MSEYLGKNIPKLGFGLMRLPKMANDVSKIDIEQTKKMVDMFLDAGLTYFDTAYVYDGGGSEEAIKEALVKRYPRENYQLATKLCAWIGCTDETTAKAQFETSLKRTGAGYFDFYLLHALQTVNYKKYADYNLWDFARDLKEQGKVKHWGFSFHSTPEILDDLLTKYPDAEFVQLQINYADWEDKTIASRANYEVARKHNKPVIIMEPVKGGTLANPPKQVLDLLKEANPNASAASWAIRFAASLEGIITVLSGMSNVEQMADNLSYMKDFKPLTSAERKVIEKAQDILKGIDTIPCTACRYCTSGCPQNISIPDVLAAKNHLSIYGDMAAAKGQYQFSQVFGAKASECVECGQCENACPQQIKIIGHLKECVKLFE